MLAIAILLVTRSIRGMGAKARSKYGIICPDELQCKSCTDCAANTIVVQNVQSFISIIKFVKIHPRRIIRIIRTEQLRGKYNVDITVSSLRHVRCTD